MATKRTTKTTAGKAAPASRKRSSTQQGGASQAGAAKTSRGGAAGGGARSGGSGETPSSRASAMAAQAKIMTPEEAFKMYRANAKIALEIIDAAIEETAKLRRFQFQGEEVARTMQKRAARDVVEADDPQSMLAAGQVATRDAMQRAMNYWREMFDLVAQIQKRLFSLIEAQMAGVPGVKETKAALTMLPDMSQAQNLVNALQGIMSSGGATFTSMQKAMGDLTRFAQGAAGQAAAGQGGSGAGER
jgi:phasin family protein